MTSLLNYFTKLKEEKKKGFVPYLTAGYPDLSSTPALLKAAALAGAAAVELGIPFSDPVADGPVLQKAAFEALQNGATLEYALDASASVSKEISAPILLMGYVNPFLKMGWKKLAEKAKKAGAAGFIIADLPLEEAAATGKLLAHYDLGLCPLCAPTTQSDRLRKIGEICTGFVYLVSVKGVTGARADSSAELPSLVKRARAKTAKPLYAGFGLSTPEQARRAARLADGVILGSRIARFLEENRAEPDLDRRLAGFLSEWKLEEGVPCA